MGYVLDLIFGDPHGMWHPICFIGNMISFFERRLQSDWVHEQIAKADCECPLYFVAKMNRTISPRVACEATLLLYKIDTVKRIGKI